LDSLLKGANDREENEVAECTENAAAEEVRVVKGISDGEGWERVRKALREKTSR